MIKYRLVNYNRAAIKETLERIGKVRFEKTMGNNGLPMPKRLDRFKLVQLKKTCSVEYKYPGEFNYAQLFLIKHYEMPKEGWQQEENLH